MILRVGLLLVTARRSYGRRHPGARAGRDGNGLDMAVLTVVAAVAPILAAVIGVVDGPAVGPAGPAPAGR